MTDSRLIRILAVALAFALPACSSGLRLSPYRVDVRQGNMVTQEMAALLKPGMTKDQVRFVLGTPLVKDIFHADRWDYVYRYQPGVGEVQERKLAVFFADGKLTRVSGDVISGSGDTTAAIAEGAETAGLPPVVAPVVDIVPNQVEPLPAPQ
jgi:outer membrane protein assembly factor BamE